MIKTVLTIIIITTAIFIFVACTAEQTNKENEGDYIIRVVYSRGMSFVISLGTDGVLTTLLGSVEWTQEEPTSPDFSINRIDKTASVELTQEQFQAIVDLASQITVADKMYDPGTIDGGWMFDVIYEGRIYRYIGDILLNSEDRHSFYDTEDIPDIPHMTELLRRLIDYSPLWMPTSFGWEVQYSLRLSRPDSWTPNHRIWANERTWSVTLADENVHIFNHEVQENQLDEGMIHADYIVHDYIIHVVYTLTGSLDAFMLSLGRDGVLTTSRGWGGWVMLTRYESASPEFLLHTIDETAKIELSQEQFQAIVDLASKITVTDSMYNPYIYEEGVWFFDVIYKGRVYHYIDPILLNTEDRCAVFDSRIPDIPHMTELLRRLIDYSPLWMPTRFCRDENYSLYLTKPDSWTPDYRIWANARTWDVFDFVADGG